MSTISFNTKIEQIGTHSLLRVPKEESLKLPSRGLVMVEGIINGVHFQSPLEPDGKKSHWLKVEKALLQKIGAGVGDSVKLAIHPIKEWPEPEIPSDLQSALSDSIEAHTIWKNITPLSRWDWIRWINGTKNPETRKHRIVVTLSKLLHGKRSACCFNRSECTDPEVSSKGMLIEPTN